VIALLQRVARRASRSVARWSAASARPADAGLRRAADTEAVAAKLVDKVLKLRIFADDAGKMNRSLQDVQGRPAGGLAVHAGGRHAQRQPARLQRRCAAGPGSALYEAVLRLARERHPGCSRAASAPTCRCTWSTTGR
jgi:D-tyrosyl-tRNA(Tyr) deacylase